MYSLAFRPDRPFRASSGLIRSVSQLRPPSMAHGPWRLSRPTLATHIVETASKVRLHVHRLAAVLACIGQSRYRAATFQTVKGSRYPALPEFAKSAS
jgi:hypothetical protein